MIPLGQHQREMQANRSAWNAKPLLRQIYSGFYQRVLGLVDGRIPGRIAEIGSGIGNLKAHFPQAISTDLFANPWLDLVCDGYELPFRDGALSHLVAFDVFHHLAAPGAFLREARRVLTRSGRLILFEPFISWISFPVYGLLHHEPVGWRQPIHLGESAPRPRTYYAAQGNATRLFFRKRAAYWPPGWNVFHAESFSGFSYLFSGGFSRPSFYPENWFGPLQRCDEILSRWPRVFGARCLVGLERNGLGG